MIENIKNWQICLGIFVFSIILYSNTIHHGFVLDDTLSITNNNFVKKGFEGIGDIWSNDYFVGAHGRSFDLTGGRYRPLSLTTFAIGYEFWGLNSKIEHSINIILYALSTVLIFLSLTKILTNERKYLALVSTLLFVCHPIHSEVVANIKSRDEILSLLFVMAALFIFFSNIKLNYVWGSIGLFLALLSKEIAASYIIIIPLLILFFKKDKKTFWRSTASILVVLGLYLFLRQNYSAGFSEGNVASNLMDNPFLDLDLNTRLGTCFTILIKYITLLIVPLELSYDYSYQALEYSTLSGLQAILGLIVLVAIIVYLSRTFLKFLSTKRSPDRITLFGVLSFFMPYLIVSNIFFNIGTFMGERFIYSASVGFCVLMALAIVHLRSVNKILGGFTVIALLMLFSIKTFKRSQDWKSNFTLYEADVSKVPNSARAQLFYGIALFGEYEKNKKEVTINKSIKHLKLATEINPQFYHAHYNLGLAYQKANQHQEAVRSFQKVLEIEPKHINSHFYLGISLGKGLNRIPEAIKWMERAIEVGYKGMNAYSNLGVAYGMNKEYNKALEAFMKASQERPNDPNILMNIGITYQQLGDQNKAQEYIEKAKILNPSLKTGNP